MSDGALELHFELHDPAVRLQPLARALRHELAQLARVRLVHLAHLLVESLRGLTSAAARPANWERRLRRGLSATCGPSAFGAWRGGCRAARHGHVHRSKGRQKKDTPAEAFRVGRVARRPNHELQKHGYTHGGTAQPNNVNVRRELYEWKLGVRKPMPTRRRSRSEAGARLFSPNAPYRLFGPEMDFACPPCPQSGRSTVRPRERMASPEAPNGFGPESVVRNR